MAWHKLKLVLIGILAAANLFLLFMIRQQARTLENIPDAAIEKLTALLNEDGIYLADGALSSKKQSMVICGGKLGESYYTDTASALSGSDVSLLFTTPTGVVLTMENGTRCAFSSGFGIRYESAGFAGLLQEAEFFETEIKALMNNRALVPPEARSEHAAKTAVRTFLEKIGSSSERAPQYTMDYETVYCGTDPDTSVQYIICVQTVRNQPIVSLFSTFAVLDGAVIGMKGEWCFSSVTETYSAQLYDQVNILYSVKERITAENTAAHTVLQSVSLVYAAYYQADSDLFYLIPTWRVTTDADREYYLNAVDGSFYTNEHEE